MTEPREDSVLSAEADPFPADPGAAAAMAPATDQAPNWTGRGVEPFAVGDPGRAANEVPRRLLAEPWGRHDTVIDGGIIGDLSVRAASVRGLASHYYDKPRQDDYCLGSDEDERWLITAVADGVGAARLSHHGAHIAVRQACRLVGAELANHTPDQLDWDAVFKGIAGAIVGFGHRELADGDVPPSNELIAQLATTTTITVCEALARSGPRAVVTAWIGDSSAWILRAGGGWDCISAVKNDGSEVATSAVRALPMVPSSGVDVHEATLEPGDVLLSMTDGVGDALGSGQGTVGRFLATAWQEAPHPLTFAAQVGFARKSFDDDRTVVAVWAPGAPG
jgi:hypothetical protein